MKTFVKEGNTLTVTSPAGGTVSGLPVLIGAGIFGIAVTDSVAGDDVEIKRTGVYSDQVKAAGAAWAQGDVLYWDNAAKAFTKTSGGNTRVGVAVVAALSADVVGVVDIGRPVG